jgi:hypothetical protein
VVSVRLCKQNPQIDTPAQKWAFGALRMTGRRFLTIVGIAAALVLIASTGTSWAHPGRGHDHGQAHGHRHAHVTPDKGHATKHGAVDQTAHTSNSSVNDTSRPASLSSYRPRIDINGRGHAYGRTHTDLASHPGKALGLLKHTDQPPLRNHQPQQSPPPATPTDAGEPVPPPPGVQQPAQPGPTTAPGHQNGSPPANGPPVSEPPTTQPPVERDPSGVAQVLLHSNPAAFTALPIAIVAVLAIGVCALIGLARHRA